MTASSSLNLTLRIAGGKGGEGRERGGKVEGVGRERGRERGGRGEGEGWERGGEVEGGEGGTTEAMMLRS